MAARTRQEKVEDMLRSCCRCFLLVLVLPVALGAQEEKFEPPHLPAKTPAEALKTFRLAEGFRIALAAAEPDVADPVALNFDEHGRLFVAEMAGYPNGGLGGGDISSGRIKMLEDRDGDGVFEKVVLFAEGLRFPTAVMPWRGGLLVANAPDLIYLKDTDGDGKADRKTILYTGFDTYNIQQLLNSLQVGLDNWVHACAGGKGGTIRSEQKKDMPHLTLRGRGIRFRPDVPGSLQATSGGGQYGLAADELGYWFTSTNSQVLRHIVLPEHYLARHPALAVRSTTLDIHAEGNAPKLFRVSPFEAWRVERTRRRKEGPLSKRFASTELVPGGFVTSACSPLVYQADLFPAEWYGRVFICDPANNLLHAMKLEEKGPATFTARRVYPEAEFLASTDNWFRPVNTTLGPDGAIYVADFYREVIETPLSLPEDMKKVLTLKTQGKGRIWRIAPANEPDKKGSQPGFEKAEDLVRNLASANRWRRSTAQRVLVERQEKSVLGALEELAVKGPRAGRIHALWTLEGLGGLKAEPVLAALQDGDAGLRLHGLQLGERVSTDARVRKVVAALANDPSPRVRFQAALSLGSLADASERAAPLAHLLLKDGDDSWMRTAVLSSAHGIEGDLLVAVLKDPSFGKLPEVQRLALLTQLAALGGAEGKGAFWTVVVPQLERPTISEDWRFRILDQLAASTPGGLLDPKKQGKAAAAVDRIVVAARNAAGDGKRAAADRLAALGLLRHLRLEPEGTILFGLVDAAQPPEIQNAALEALAHLAEGQQAAQAKKIGGWLLDAYPRVGTAGRSRIVEGLLAYPNRLPVFLDAVAAGKIRLGALDPVQTARLKATYGKRPEVKKLLEAQPATERAKVVREHAGVLDLTPVVDRGRMVFRKNCAICHRLEEHGQEVGADLKAALPNKTAEQLLGDILDPSREVDPRWLEYLVATRSGKVLTGILASESAASLTLKRAEGMEDTILRRQIESIQATGKSLMPEGLERQMSRQDLADLIGYLLEVRSRK